MFAQIVKGPQKRREFHQFEKGEFLVSVETGYAGVKTDDGSILWVTGESKGKITPSSGVPRYTVYGVPTEVVITT